MNYTGLIDNIKNIFMLTCSYCCVFLMWIHTVCPITSCHRNDREISCDIILCEKENKKEKPVTERIHRASALMSIT